MAEHNNLGNTGENLAIEHLVSKGHQIKEKNWRYKHDEIDIISLKDNCLIVTEVKTRSSNYFGNPEVFINKAKQRRIVKATAFYCDKNSIELEVRFDIVSIVIHPNGHQLNHIENAFSPLEL